jgi:signal peptidase II
VDWIQIPHWPVFNIADSCIVCGGVLAVFLAVRGVRIDASVADRHAAQRQAPAQESPADEAGNPPGDQAAPEPPRSQDQHGGDGA